MADDDAPEQPDEKPSEKPPKAEKADRLPHFLPPDSDSPPAPSGPGLWEKIKAHPTWIAIGIAALGLIVTYLIWQQQTANGTAAGTVTAVPATATDTTGTAATGSTDYNTDPAVLAELAQLEADITALENGGSSGTVTPPPPVTPPTTPPGTMPGQPIGPTGPAQQPPGPSPIHPVPAQKPAMIKAASLPIQNRLRTE